MGGKDGTVAGAPRLSEALTSEQREILEKRGVLSPQEIHRLASKTKRMMEKKASRQEGIEASRPESDAATKRRSDEGKAVEKPSCHSDYVDPEAAKRLQAERAGSEVLVQVDVRPALGIAKDETRVV
jgi:phosphomethylpyrimidine synthase